MKKYLILFPIIFVLFKTNAQVGINTDEPLVDLHVQAEDPENPEPNEGVIIPRVNSLNVTDAKETGLLVFLDFENPSTIEIEKGFYWWNGTQWIPFFSMNKMTKDRTITYVSCSDSFREGNITNNSSTSVRTMQFTPESLVANDSENFEINANSELVVKKAGTYHVQAVISLNFSNSSNGRDAYEAKILLNGVEPTPRLRTAYGFPSGGTSFNSNTAISGFATLNANDRIRIEINRYYLDPDSGVNAVMTPNGNMSNLTLRYLGQL